MSRRRLGAALVAALAGVGAHAQTPGTTPAACPAAPPATPIAQASAAERQREMALLGLTTMQPAVGAYDIGRPCNANYDEARANPHPALPPLLVMNDGRKVTRALWPQRRAEIVRLFEDDVYGRYPAQLPGVTWTVTGTDRQDVGGVPAVVKHVTGHVDNRAYPAINVEIVMDVVTPAAAQGRGVPVIIGGGSVRPRPSFPRPTPAPGQIVHQLAAPADAPDSARLLLTQGWGFVWIDTNAVQADNGAGLGKGIIGLVNKGQPRSLADWGVLRTWAWADSRAIDWLVTDPDVDARRIGIFGHSRGGKAALVAMADDPRIAIGYISSSGAGGVDLYRRDYGETLGNIAAANEYHWFAGNFLKYAAADFPRDRLPFDAHEFLALAAPRPVFIGGGALLTDPVYVPGDAWQDAQGMFKSAVAASPAWTLLGARGLGTTTFPPMETLVDSGDIAFRQHRWGHTPAPNWPAFIAFAARYFDK